MECKLSTKKFFSAFLRDFFLWLDWLSGDGSLRHLVLPCCVALGRALICMAVSRMTFCCRPWEGISFFGGLIWLSWFGWVDYVELSITAIQCFDSAILFTSLLILLNVCNVYFLMDALALVKLDNKSLFNKKGRKKTFFWFLMKKSTLTMKGIFWTKKMKKMTV